MDLLLEAASNGDGGSKSDVPGGKPARKLAKLLAPLADEYDAVFLDCPPSVSLVSENVLHAADVILVPLIPTTLSVRTLEQLAAFVGEFNGHPPGSARVLLDGRSAQETAPGNNRKAFRRTDRGGSHRHPGSIGHRDDVGRARPGRRVRA